MRFLGFFCLSISSLKWEGEDLPAIRALGGADAANSPGLEEMKSPSCHSPPKRRITRESLMQLTANLYRGCSPQETLPAALPVDFQTHP